jgi:hypothetical protein
LDLAIILQLGCDEVIYRKRRKYVRPAVKFMGLGSRIPPDTSCGAVPVQALLAAAVEPLTRLPSPILISLQKSAESPLAA